MVPSGLNTARLGLKKPEIVAVTVLVAVLITDTVLEEWFDTYTLVPSGETTADRGVVPTLMVVTRALVAVL